MHWVDGNHLDIEIGDKSTVTLSFHDVNGVRIAYHVPRRLMRVTEGLERQTEALHRAGKLTEQDYETNKKVNQAFLRWQNDFIQWASENAIIDEAR